MSRCELLPRLTQSWLRGQTDRPSWRRVWGREVSDGHLNVIITFNLHISERTQERIMRNITGSCEVFESKQLSELIYFFDSHAIIF